MFLTMMGITGTWMGLNAFMLVGRFLPLIRWILMIKSSPPTIVRKRVLRFEFFPEKRGESIKIKNLHPNHEI